MNYRFLVVAAVTGITGLCLLGFSIYGTAHKVNMAGWLFAILFLLIAFASIVKLLKGDNL